MGQLLTQRDGWHIVQKTQEQHDTPPHVTVDGLFKLAST